jgi:hypothetical protein
MEAPARRLLVCLILGLLNIACANEAASNDGTRSSALRIEEHILSHHASRGAAAGSLVNEKSMDAALTANDAAATRSSAARKSSGGSSGTITLFTQMSERMGIALSPPSSLSRFGISDKEPQALLPSIPQYDSASEAEEKVKVMLANDLSLRSVGAAMMVEVSSSRKVISGDAVASDHHGSNFWHSSRLWEPYSFEQVAKAQAEGWEQKKSSSNGMLVVIVLAVAVVGTGVVLLVTKGGGGSEGSYAASQEPRMYGQTPYASQAPYASQVPGMHPFSSARTHHSLHSCQSVPTGPASTSSVISHMRDPRFATGEHGVQGQSAVMGRREAAQAAYGGYRGGGHPAAPWGSQHM